MDEIDVVVRCIHRIRAYQIGGVIIVGCVREREHAAGVIQRKLPGINTTGYRITECGIACIGIGGSHRDDRACRIFINGGGVRTADNWRHINDNAPPVRPGAIAIVVLRPDAELIIHIAVGARVDEGGAGTSESHSVAVPGEWQCSSIARLDIVAGNRRTDVRRREPTHDEFIPTVRIHLRCHCHRWRVRLAGQLR